MNDADRTLLRELRTALLHLHKTLLDWQRAEFEQDRGPMPATQLLQFIFNDEAFAWLRPMSGLIVAIDEALAAKSPAMSPLIAQARDLIAQARDLIAQARDLAAPAAGSAYSARYQTALQELPEAVLAHRDLVTLLKLHNPQASA